MLVLVNTRRLLARGIQLFATLAFCSLKLLSWLTTCEGALGLVAGSVRCRRREECSSVLVHSGDQLPALWPVQHYVLVHCGTCLADASVNCGEVVRTGCSYIEVLMCQTKQQDNVFVHSDFRIRSVWMTQLCVRTLLVPGADVVNVTALYSYAVGTRCRRCERHSSVFVRCWYQVPTLWTSQLCVRTLLVPGAGVVNGTTMCSYLTTTRCQRYKQYNGVLAHWQCVHPALWLCACMWPPEHALRCPLHKDMESSLKCGCRVHRHTGRSWLFTAW